jgi:hypothetical protein
MRHVVWQAAACELHAIMQLVTIEVCATRILPTASPAEWHSAMANPQAKSKRAIPPQGMLRSLSPSIALGDRRGNVPARSLELTG